MSPLIGIFLFENLLALGAVKTAQSVKCLLYKNKDLSLKAKAYAKSLGVVTLASNPKS